MSIVQVYLEEIGCSLGAGSLTSVGETPQISRAYCAIVRSLENLPDDAMFMTHFLAHSLGFCAQTKSNSITKNVFKGKQTYRNQIITQIHWQ